MIERCKELRREENHKITISHILRAINMFTFSVVGPLGFLAKDGKILPDSLNWDLQNDFLEAQNPKTIEALDKMLSV